MDCQYVCDFILGQATLSWYEIHRDRNNRHWPLLMELADEIFKERGYASALSTFNPNDEVQVEKHKDTFFGHVSSCARCYLNWWGFPLGPDTDVITSHQQDLVELEEGFDRLIDMMLDEAELSDGTTD